jgi:TetR/AcrR family transcriptional regulator
VESSEQIRAAATRLFASRGFEGTSLQDIASEVGVTKQTLLYHYASKDALRRAVLDQVLAHWRERLPQMLHAFTSGHRRFEALTGELVAFFESDPDRARLLVRELLDNADETRRMLSDSLRPWILLVAEYVREGQRGGIIHARVDAESYVLHVIVLVITTVAHRSVLVTALGQGSTKELEKRHMAELLRLTHDGLFKR